MKEEKTQHKDTPSLLQQITETVLYEGYSLYPYYRSSSKNTKPVPFGAVYPKQYQQHNADVHATTCTECIIKGRGDTKVAIKVRFLHLRDKKLLRIDPAGLGPGQFKPADSIEENGKTYFSGWEAVEREMKIGDFKLSELVQNGTEKEVAFPGEQANDLIYGEDETITGNIIISQSAINGNISVSAKPVDNEKGFKITVEITNKTDVEEPKKCSRNDVYALSFLSTHTILTTEAGQFISQTDPQAAWQTAVEACNNINTWPILVEKDDKTMLSSPIVLYDHPEIAPESMGDMFDGTEIEEALMLHMATMPEDEKQKIDQDDPKMKAMMKRVESVTPEEIMSLHGGFKEVKQKSDEEKKEAEL